MKFNKYSKDILQKKNKQTKQSKQSIQKKKKKRKSITKTKHTNETKKYPPPKKKTPNTNEQNKTKSKNKTNKRITLANVLDAKCPAAFTYIVPETFDFVDFVLLNGELTLSACWTELDT